MLSIALCGFNNLEKIGLSFLIRNSYPIADITYLESDDMLLGFDGVVLSSRYFETWIKKSASNLSALVFLDDLARVNDVPNTTIIHSFHGSKALDFQVCEWLTEIAMRIDFERGHKVAPREQVFLSQRERQVMKLLSEGASNESIALVLGIGVATVKTHLCRIYGKLRAFNRVHAVALYREIALRDHRQDEDDASKTVRDTT